jgi:group I intron endonuclease
MIIYKLQNNRSGKIYIGQTTRSLDTRIREHFRQKKSPISKALRSVGLNGFTATVIDHAHSHEELDEKERFWITHYDCIVPNGYNICTGGEGARGWHPTDEQRAKMRQSHIGKVTGAKNPMYGKTGELNHFYGKKHSEKTRAKMSEHAKQRNLTYGRNPRARKVQCINTGEVFNSVKEAAEKYGLSRTGVNNCCIGYRNSCHGYRWRYVDGE